jgi:predicted nucleotidyltransferase
MSKPRILEEERKKPKRLSAEEKKRLVDIIRKILEKEDRVEIAVIYGGFLNSGVFRDIDVAIYIDLRSDYGQELVFVEEIRDRLEKVTGISVDIQLLNRAPPRFVYNILSGGKTIVEKKPGVSSILRIHSLDEMKRLKKHISSQSTSYHYPQI